MKGILMTTRLKRGFALNLLLILGLCTVFVLDRVNAQFVETFNTTSVAWSPDGTKFALAGTTGQSAFLQIFHSQTGEVTYQITLEANGFTSMRWSPNGKYVALGGYDYRVWIVDVELAQVVTSLSGHEATVSSVDWSPDGTKLVSAGNWDGLTILWNVETFQLERIVERSNLFVTAARFDPSGQRIAIASEAGITIHSSTNSDRSYVRYAREFNVSTIEFNRDGTFIAFGTQMFPSVVNPEATRTAQIGIVNVSDGSIRTTFPTNTLTVYGLAWSPSSQEIATHSADGSVRIWDLETQIAVEQYFGVEQYPGSVSFSPFGGRLAFGRTVVQSNSVSTTEQQPIITEDRTNALYNIVVPAPSPERLQAITDACGLAPAADTALTAEISTQNYAGFTAQLEALPEDALPPGCRADLLAVAAALDAQGE
jgi:WD40 repeat protein